MHDPGPPLMIGFAMIALTALTSLAARRSRLPQSILLVVVGAALALAPHVPRVTLHPDLVLLLLLPPLLYTSGVGMSWRGFRSNLRAIMLLAVGCVLFTATAVAAATHWLLHLPWAVGFVLGAVVSPPDAVAPMAIARRLSVPKRVLTILEGEGLVNDATALILFSFAVAAVATGGVSLLRATETFGLIVVGETLWGVAIGWGALRLRAWTQDTEVEMLMALLTPFAAFWPPHFLGGSGVLSAVAAGLYTSWNGPRLISPATRLQGFFVWGLMVYLVEGIVFFLMGLQAPVALEVDAPGGLRILWGAAVTLAVVIGIRFVWVFPASYLPGISAAGARSKPSWQETFLIGFTGIRGVVSLVAALSIPEEVAGHPFPYRDLILFLTFGVIMVSLLGQGVALPAVIRALGLDRAGDREAEEDKRNEIRARVVGAEAALAKLAELERQGALTGSADRYRRLGEDRRLFFLQASEPQPSEGDSVQAREGASLRLQLVAAERASIAAQFAAGRLSDEARRRIERELDLEDARIRHTVDSAMGPGFVEI